MKLKDNEDIGISFDQFYMIHEGGTKEYRIIFLSNLDNGNSLVIRRFGKIGTWGQVKVDMFSSVSIADGEVSGLIKSKTGRGYQFKKDPESTTLTGGKSFMGRLMMYIPKMGYKNLDHLVGEGHGLETMDPEDIEFVVDKEGKYRKKDKLKLMDVKKVEIELKAKEAELEIKRQKMQYESNEEWGAF